jgi:NAD(P)-dependent dehydrogenase (short-subunit alcohol dehydrogenase family)
MERSASSQVFPLISWTLTLGGAQGIGAAAVEIFVDAGAKVVFADMNTAGGKATEEKVKGYQYCS